MMGETWHLTIKHGPGSVEHFHHFLLGFFVPLTHHLATSLANASFERLIIRSCGPLDGIIGELGDGRIRIVDKDEHSRISADCRVVSAEASRGSPTPAAVAKFLSVEGYDYPIDYSYRAFSSARSILLSREAVRSEIDRLRREWPPGRTRILLIERGPPNPFYNSTQSEMRGAGNERRSIANHEELYRALQHDFGGCLNIRTEGTTLSRQIALFSSAEIIVAQHGAALSNLIWASETARVIEVFPKTLRPEQLKEDCFRYLSKCLGLRYRKILQQNEHSPVDVKQILETVRALCNSPPPPFEARLQRAHFTLLQACNRSKRSLRKILEKAGWR